MKLGRMVRAGVANVVLRSQPKIAQRKSHVMLAGRYRVIEDKRKKIIEITGWNSRQNLTNAALLTRRQGAKVATKFMR